MIENYFFMRITGHLWKLLFTKKIQLADIQYKV